MKVIRVIWPALACLSLLLFLTAAAAAQGASGYRQIDKIAIGGEGGWDYVYADSENQRLYVSHATKIVVIDTKTNKIVGEIAGLKGVHGVAVASKFGRGFISDGRDDSVVIFGLKDLKTIATVKVGKNPDCIIYDPGSKRVFAFNRGSSNVTAIDAEKGTVAGTFDLGGHPEFAASDDKGKVFVNLDDKSEVVAIDSKKLTVLAHWTLAPDGEDPSGMAIDLKHKRLVVVCGGSKKMVFMDTETGKVTGSVAIGNGTDAAGFDEKDNLAFSSNGEGNLTVVRVDKGDKYTLVENVTTARGARTMAVDTRTHKIYLPTAQFGETPPVTKENPRPRPKMIPDSFVILVFGK